MAAMSDEARTETLQTAAATAGTLPAAQDLDPAGVAALLRAFYRDVLGEDLRAQSSRDLLGAALSHRTGALRRSPGTATVRVLAPSEEERGWAAQATLVEIVTDDMPFLVDSVTAELARHDHTVRLLVHPQPRVRRDADGTLRDVLDPDDDAPDALTESWVHLHIDPVPDADVRASLAAGLHRVLADVRAAVEDWRPMTDRAREISRRLAADPPTGLPAEEVDEARRLLDWLADGQFVFLGFREYAFTPGDDVEEAYLDPVPGTGLGLLGEDDDGDRRVLPPAAARKAAEPRLVIVTQANSRSTVHRPEYLDYVAVKVIDGTGRVTGEQRFIGLFTPTAYDWSVTEVPFVSRKVRQVAHRVGYAPASYLGKTLLRVLEAYPRDELFQAPVAQLAEVSTAVVHLRHRPRTRVFLRADDYERFVAAVVYLAQERYTPAVRDRIEAVLRDAVGGTSVEHATLVAESSLAQLYFVVRVTPGAGLPSLDPGELEQRVAAATRTWEEELAEAAAERHGAQTARELLARFGAGFPEGYKEDTGPQEAAADLHHLAGLTGDLLDLRLYLPPGAPPEGRRLKLYRRGTLALSAVLPIFQGLGVEVIDQRPHTVREADGTELYVSDLGLDLRSGRLWPSEPEDFATRLRDAFLAVWHRTVEDDGFNALVLLAGLTWQQVLVLRATAAYLRQTGAVFSREYVESTLQGNPGLARLLVELFETRFDPDRFTGDGERERAEEDVTHRIAAGLDDVASLDQDRIVRALAGILRATVRTSYYQRLHPTQGGHDGPPTITSKLDPHRVPDLPAPRPTHELWVYGPRVEGVHLRFGEIARGGLRWSDRREDFRTEVLGLVKAQVVKNAIIVPAGAKGGFVAKDLPDPADRDAWLAAGRAAYRAFVSALLDVTDDIDDGTVVPPERLVRHDGDDPYLVVAADKGTAAFSDLANEVSQEHGFWLDDAFASGGSAGYDHKKMGITARGAWVAVQRHFRERGHDTQREDFTVVGIGDMSGDVFGNGMLRSEHIRLVAAFDHRHVFLDPDPDAAASFAERRRLFELPRSSWADYDESLLSPGGGVYPRTAKSVPISPEVRERLGLAEDVERLTPAELIRAVLTAPVDLLWNGGIGTYVKATTESHADIGDRANDAIRVDGAELRCHVVGEGGNLGVSQLGRVEAARSGVHLNTDAIDNSAGVDSSDQEVNIKILLAGPVAAGRLARDDRDRLLAAMTDDVAARVLRNNYEQNVILGNARIQRALMLGAHQRFVHWLEERGELDRALEFLPSDAEIARRDEHGEGLTSPELSVLVAYAKLALQDDLVASDLPDDPWLERELREYFPERLQAEFAAEIAGHRLRREIIATRVAGSVVNRGGITFVHRAQDETGADAAQVARAFVISREVFDLAAFVRHVEELDDAVGTEVQSDLYLEFRRLLDRAVRWFVEHGTPGLDIAGEIDRFAPTVRRLVPGLAPLVRGRARQDVLDRVADLTGQGVPEALAETAALLVEMFSLLDVVVLGERTGQPADRVAAVRFAAEEHFGIDRLLVRVRALPREQRWDALARGALREDLHGVLNLLTDRVLAAGDDTASPDELLRAWDDAHPTGTERLREVLTELDEQEDASLASLSVALRTLRALVA